MILDYNYNSNKKNFSISYIKENGAKQVLNFNVERFKSYYKTPAGQYTNWDGCKCDIRWTERPHKFDIKTYIKELPEDYRKLFDGKTPPKLYTFDIETMINEETNEFPEPSEAKFPITVISVVSSNLDCIVLGWKDELVDKNKLQNQFEQYLNNIPFYKELNINTPTIRYIKFPNEESMLIYFLQNIVAKVPILAGWNSILFDWQYIQNRCRGYYPNIYFGICSPTRTLHRKNYIDQRQNKIQLSFPDHTLVCDMMDIVDNFDYVVMPIKDSLSLDYISHEMLGANKVEYEGTLQHLYNTDYQRYVFYNAIDSILVQLIDKKFKTLSNIYIQAKYCEEKIESCFSKIALSEALVFNYFYENGIKMVPISIEGRERGRLIGAYVKKPIPGKHMWTVCNDFASLYPSTIITCNLSFENFIGHFYDDEKLKQYASDPSKYIVIGPNVHINEGSIEKPELGRCIGTFLNDEVLESYRKDPNYFVSVNGCVYKNDKDYAFRTIQRTLKANRDTAKYLSKGLDASVMSDIEHIIKGDKVKYKEYPKNMIDALNEIHYDVKCSSDIQKMTMDDIEKFKHALQEEITYYSNYEQAQKNLGNSMYGGVSHISFALYSIELANDITGEARNIIHMMEHHIPDFWRNNWIGLKDLHKELGIEVDEQKAKHILDTTYFVPEEDDPDAYHKSSFVIPVYGDTDSNYLSYNELLNSIKGIENMTSEQKAHIIVDINLKFMDQHNKEFMDEYYKSRHVNSVQKFELETLGHGCWLDVKKRYAQLLFWKDGKYFDMDDLKMKVKGLEIVKSSYPKCAREILKKITRYYLEENDDTYMLQKLNIKMQELKSTYMNAPIEDICGNINVNNYTKYIINDSGETLEVAPKCPSTVRALGNYNFIRNKYNLPGEPIFGGKMKVYMYYPEGATNKTEPSYFAFRSMDYPKWADKYAPVAREKMFQQYVIDPFNRIIESAKIGELKIDGSIELNLFNF